MIAQLINTIQHLRLQHPDLVVVIYGPTATGKSGLSLCLADLFSKYNVLSSGASEAESKDLLSIKIKDSSTPRVLPTGAQVGMTKNGGQVEIISADSRQVYRYMDIGTDKILQADRDQVPHFGIDMVDPDENYTAHRRQQDAKRRISDIHGRGHLPVIVGGTGLYIDTIYKNFNLPQDVSADRERRAVLESLEQSEPGYLRNLLNSIDPVTAVQFHPKNTRYLIRAIEIYEQTGIPKSVLVQEHPVDHPLLMVSVTRDTETANTLIHQRVEEMIDRGLVDEVQGLLDRGYSPDLQSMNGIGYRQTVEWLKVESRKSKVEGLYAPYDFTNLIDSITLASVQYAKRQRVRFRRYKKDARECPKDRVTYMTIEL